MKKWKLHTLGYRLANFFACFNKKTSLRQSDYIPVITENTFIIWEPCTHSHAEIVPGYAKYLLDLGYHVLVLMNPLRFDEGLFSRFDTPNITCAQMSARQIKAFFRHNDLAKAAGVLVTSVDKLCPNGDVNKVYKFFNKEVNVRKLFFVAHDIKLYVDKGIPPNKLITLRAMDYKNAQTHVINPHYFGQVKLHNKNHITHFVTIGALSNKRKNVHILIEAVQTLLDKGIKNFKVIVVGKGHLQDLPAKVKPYFTITGRLNFIDMYNIIEQADFLLTAFDQKPEHLRYITTGTSGMFQLAYGFLKPLVIRKSFAAINGCNENNAILYDNNHAYHLAMQQAIELNQDQYQMMQNHLKNYAKQLEQESKDNFKTLIENIHV